MWSAMIQQIELNARTTWFSVTLWFELYAWFHSQLAHTDDDTRKRARAFVAWSRRRRTTAVGVGSGYTCSFVNWSWRYGSLLRAVIVKIVCSILTQGLNARCDAAKCCWILGFRILGVSLVRNKVQANWFYFSVARADAGWVLWCRCKNTCRVQRFPDNPPVVDLYTYIWLCFNTIVLCQLLVALSYLVHVCEKWLRLYCLILQSRPTSPHSMENALSQWYESKWTFLPPTLLFAVSSNITTESIRSWLLWQDQLFRKVHEEHRYPIKWIDKWHWTFRFCLLPRF